MQLDVLETVAGVHVPTTPSIDIFENWGKGPLKHKVSMMLKVVVKNGFIWIVYVEDELQYPLKVGVTVIFAEYVEKLVLVAVNDGTFPEPLAAKPIAGLEFVHVMLAPDGELTKFVAEIMLLGHP